MLNCIGVLACMHWEVISVLALLNLLLLELRGMMDRMSMFSAGRLIVALRA